VVAPIALHDWMIPDESGDGPDRTIDDRDKRRENILL
jgi:hypothetical protein